MSAEATDRLRKAAAARSSRDARFRSSRAFERVEAFGGIFRFAYQVVARAVRPPFNWLGQAVTEAGSACWRCAAPLFISHLVYLIGFGLLLFATVLNMLGLADRENGIVSIIWTREISTWVTGMVFAGVVGSAMTADLGARKIREELEALAVLGVPQLPMLVLPRVLGLTIAAPVLAWASLAVMSIANITLGPAVLQISQPVLFDALKENLYSLDIILVVTVKMAILGFFVGVVCCYKGLNSKAGAEGVGNAVNETVVITFFGIWMFNSLYNLAYFAIFPDVGVFRG